MKIYDEHKNSNSNEHGKSNQWKEEQAIVSIFTMEDDQPDVILNEVIEQNSSKE